MRNEDASELIENRTSGLTSGTLCVTLEEQDEAHLALSLFSLFMTPTIPVVTSLVKPKANSQAANILRFFNASSHTLPALTSQKVVPITAECSNIFSVSWVVRVLKQCCAGHLPIMPVTISPRTIFTASTDDSCRRLRTGSSVCFADYTFPPNERDVFGATTGCLGCGTCAEKIRVLAKRKSSGSGAAFGSSHRFYFRQETWVIDKRTKCGIIDTKISHVCSEI